MEEYKNTCTCVLVDNLDNSSDIVVGNVVVVAFFFTLTQTTKTGRIKQITQCKDEQIIFIEGDLCQLTLVEEIFTNHGMQAKKKKKSTLTIMTQDLLTQSCTLLVLNMSGKATRFRCIITSTTWCPR